MGFNIDTKELKKEFKLSELEKKIIDESGTNNTAAINKSQITAQVILSSRTDKNSKILNRLTGALVFVGLVQVLIALCF